MKDRYVIVIPHDHDAILLHCDDGDTMELKYLQGIVEGNIETVPTALAANWAHEDGINQIVLIVNEEGKLQGLPYNLNANDLMLNVERDYIVGNAVLMAVRGEELIGFTKDAAENIIKKWKLCAEEQK